MVRIGVKRLKEINFNSLKYSHSSNVTLPDTPFYISPDKAQEALASAKDGGESEPVTDSGECSSANAN